MPLQGNKQPQNPYAVASKLGKPVGNRSPEAIQWDIDNKPKTAWDLQGESAGLQNELNTANQQIVDRGIVKTLRDAGYKGTRIISSNDWGGWGNLGGPEKANELYGQILAYGKQTGDWSNMDKFMDAAQYGSRKYHRSGFMGTGIRISPMAMMGIAAGGFGALGGFAGAAGSAGHSLGSAAAASTASSLAAPAIGSLGQFAISQGAQKLLGKDPVPQGVTVPGATDEQIAQLQAANSAQATQTSGAVQNNALGVNPAELIAKAPPSVANNNYLANRNAPNRIAENAVAGNAVADDRAFRDQKNGLLSSGNYLGNREKYFDWRRS
jgi:hypothetical protein